MRVANPRDRCLLVTLVRLGLEGEPLNWTLIDELFRCCLEFGMVLLLCLMPLALLIRREEERGQEEEMGERGVWWWLILALV